MTGINSFLQKWHNNVIPLTDMCRSYKLSGYAGWPIVYTTYKTRPAAVMRRSYKLSGYAGWPTVYTTYKTRLALLQHDGHAQIKLPRESVQVVI